MSKQEIIQRLLGDKHITVEEVMILMGQDTMKTPQIGYQMDKTFPIEFPNKENPYEFQGVTNLETTNINGCGGGGDCVECQCGPKT